MLLDCDSAGVVFVGLNVKFAIVKVEVLGVVAEYQREYPFFHDVFFVVVVVAAVEERVLLARMHVEVDVHGYFPVSLSMLDVAFQSGDLWAEVAVKCSPLAIHIKSIYAGPGVADYNSVNVNHWNDFENITGPQILCLFIIAKQKVQNSFHHEAAARFSCMDPG